MSTTRQAARARQTEGSGNAAPEAKRVCRAPKLGNQATQSSARGRGGVSGFPAGPQLAALSQHLAGYPRRGPPLLHCHDEAQRTLDALGVKGAAAGRHILVSSRLAPQMRRTVMAHELTHAAQTGARAFPGTITGIGSRQGALEREAGLGGAMGTPFPAKRRDADPGILRLYYDQEELFTTSITPSWAERLTDDELQQARTALAARRQQFPEGSAEHQSAGDNDSVLANEIARRGTDESQRNLESRHMANRPQGPPVVFGIDNRERRIFASVAATGATLEEIALYIYGSAAQTARLAEENSLVPGHVIPPGRTIRLVEGPLPDAAREILNAGLRSGTVIRTEGIPQLLEDDGRVYSIPIGGRQTQVNAAQFNAVLNGIRRTTRFEIDRVRGRFESLLDTRNRHERITNSVVRGISDWMGDVDLPGPFTYVIPMGVLAALRTELDGLEFTGDPAANARQLQTLQQRLVTLSEQLDRAQSEWSNYIEGTIRGASRTASRLETVRNVSFAAVAGMAGAVAAPAAFAALGTAGVTGATATGLSLTAAAGTGAVVRGGLEVAAPGVQVQYGPDGEPIVREDTRGAGERFTSQLYTGAVQGFTGGAGAFLAPVTSTAVTGQLAARYGQGFVQTTAGRVTSQVLTGAAVGVPTSAGGAALELAPAYARGDITGTQYAQGIGMSTLVGTGLGGATSVLPVHGLYRSGPLGLRGTPVTPRWMLAGPASPLAPFRRNVPAGHPHPLSTDIPEGFHNLPRDQLPAFTDDPAVAGYAWTRVRSGGVDQWAPIRTYGPRQDFELAWYDTPDAGPSANRILLYGQRNAAGVPMRAVQTRATQRPRGGGYSGPRAHPEMDFNETLPDGTPVRNVEGHRIDQADTTNPNALIPNSATDRANFAPEPPAWGSSRPAGFAFQGRNRLTIRMRNANPAGGTQYGQFEIYGPGTRTTADMTPVPERIIFVEYGPDGVPARAWEVRTGTADVQSGVGMRTAADIDANYGIDPALVPQAREISVQALPPAVAAAAAAPQMSMPDAATPSR